MEPRPLGLRLTDILSRPDVTLQNELLVNFGEPVLYRANWGEYTSAEDFKANLARQRKLDQITIDMIDNSGFPGGWRFGPEVDMYSDTNQELQAHIAASLARRVLTARDWDGVELMALASASTRRHVPLLTADILRREGYSIDQALFSGFACAGATVAMCDAARNRDLHDKRVLIIGLETLSGAQFDPDDIPTTWTFGNGGAAIAFKPGTEIKHIHGKRWVVDDNGIIRMPWPLLYNLSDSSDERIPRDEWPQGYEDVTEAAESIFGFYPWGAAVQLKADPNAPTAKMFGGKTFKFFARNEPRPYLNFLRDLGFPLVGPAIIHQPAFKVLEGLERGVDTLVAHEEKATGRRYSLPEMLWLMRNTKTNNVSAATAFFQMSELIRLGQLIPNKPTIVFNFGIGSLGHADAVEFLVH